MKKNSYFTLVIIFLLTFSGILWNTVPEKNVNAQSPTILSVEPQILIDPTLTPGKIFTINVTVTDVTGLYGWEFKLFYLKSVLTVNSIAFGPFLESAGATFTIDKSNPDYNTTHGLVWMADSLLAAPQGVDGTGTIASVTFEVTGLGSTKLDLTDTKLGTITGESISHTVHDGYFSNIISQAKISITPNKIIDSTLEPCHQFTVNVTISNASNVNSWELKIFYRNDVLNVSDVSFGPFLQSSGPTTQIVKSMTDNYNETHGLVWLNETLTTSTGAFGDGILATITFHVEGVGETEISLKDTKLTDPVGQPLEHSSSSGYFNNVLMAKIFIYPEEIFDPTLTPGSRLNVKVKISEVTDLYGFKLNLTYENDILNCLGVLILPYQNESNFDSKVAWNDETGELSIQVNYKPPAEPITSFTPFTVAEIYFQVSGMGVSPLHLHDTSLINAEGGEIPHETQDGLIYIVIRDVAVVELYASKADAYSPSPLNIYPGELVNITVTVENKGNLTESFTVMLLYNNELIMNVTVTDLPPQGFQTISVIWNTSGFPPCYNATLNAYVVPVPYETNLEDNTFTDGIISITLIGDVNGDGIINIYDVIQAGNAFGTYLGEPEYDERADINHDGTIDIYDLILIGLHFGESY